MLRLFVLAAVLCVLCASGCASGPDARRHLTALVFGDTERRAEIESALTELDAEAEIEIAALPEVAPAGLDPHGVGDIGDRIARARAAYDEGEYERCLEALADADLFDRALEAGDRATAARVTWWRAACVRASSGPEAAQPSLDVMATLDLPRPESEVEAVAASLDVQLADRRAAVASGARVTLSIEVPVDARVRVDGTEIACAGTCEVSLVSGRHHVRAEADGRVPRVSWIDVGPDGASLALPLEDASSEVASAEWQARYSRAGDRESAASVALLRRVLGTEHLVLLLADTDAQPTSSQLSGFQLSGLYANDEGIDARATRGAVSPPVTDAVNSLLFELVPWARPEAWWETPWPWAILGVVVAAVASGLTYYYTAPITGPSVVRLRVMP